MKSKLLMLAALLIFAAPALAQRFPRVANTLADMVASNPNVVHTNVFVADTNRGGMFYWSSGSTQTTNLGTIFTTTYPGASGRYIREIDGPLNARWFGAVSDATQAGAGTDSAPAINAALALTSYAVYIPAGSYKLSSPLLLSRDNIRLYGDSAATRLFAATAGLNVITNSRGAVLNSVLVEGLLFQCVDGVAGGTALFLNNFNNSVFRDFTVFLDSDSAVTGFLKGIYGYGTFAIGGGYRNQFSDFFIRTISTASAIGIEFDADTAGYGPNGSSFKGGAVAVNGGRGMWLKNTQAVDVEGVVFEGDMLPQAIRADNFGGTSMGVSVKNSYFEGLTAAMTNAIYFNGDGGFSENNTYASGITTPIIVGSRGIHIEPTAQGGDKLLVTTGTVFSRRLGIDIGVDPPPLTNYTAHIGSESSGAGSMLLDAGDSGTTEFNLWGGTTNRLWLIKFDDNTNSYALAFSGARTDGNARTNVLYLSNDGTGNVTLNGGLYIGTNTASLAGENNLWVEKYLQFGDGAAKVSTGTGTPEGSLVRDPGSLYLDRNGALWLKFTGSGNTGWDTVLTVAGGGVPSTRTITVAGTAGEVASSAGAQDLSANRTWTLSLPAAIDLGGKTSFELPNSAAPVTDAFAELAGDDNAWAASRGALQVFDGTEGTYVVAVPTSDVPVNGDVITYNVGGFFEFLPGGGGAGDITAVGDVSSGAAFTGTQGRLLTFNNAGGDGTLDYDGTSFVLSHPLSLGAAGVRLSGDGDGALTFLGLGNGADETLILNLDDTANEAVLSSSTSLTNINLSANTLSLSVPAKAYDATQWNGDLTAPARDDVRDLVEARISGGLITSYFTKTITDDAINTIFTIAVPAALDAVGCHVTYTLKASDASDVTIRTGNFEFLGTKDAGVYDVGTDVGVSYLQRASGGAAVIDVVEASDGAANLLNCKLNIATLGWTPTTFTGYFQVTVHGPNAVVFVP